MLTDAQQMEVNMIKERLKMCCIDAPFIKQLIDFIKSERDIYISSIWNSNVELDKSVICNLLLGIKKEVFIEKIREV